MQQVTKVYRAFSVRPRLVGFLLGAVLIPFLVPARFGAATRFLIGWDIATLGYLAALWSMMLRDSVEDMRRRADEQDEGAAMVLTITCLAAVASLVGIGAELSGAKELDPGVRAWHVGLVALTVVLSWFLVHTMFALHYAHEFYTQERRTTPPLTFPDGMKRPHYWEFLYFSFVIGTASATADISIASSGIRRTAMAHGILAFFFNTTILALAINVGASLL